MAEITAKYGDYKGAKVTIKDSLKWFEFSAVSKAITAANGDTSIANQIMIKIGVSAITLPDGKTCTEPLEILKLIDQFDVRDVQRLLTALAKLVKDDETSDPKEN